MAFLLVGLHHSLSPTKPFLTYHFPPYNPSPLISEFGDYKGGVIGPVCSCVSPHLFLSVSRATVREQTGHASSFPSLTLTSFALTWEGRMHEEEARRWEERDLTHRSLASSPINSLSFLPSLTEESRAMAGNGELRIGCVVRSFPLL